MSAIRVVIDRIEGEMAVLLVGDENCRVVLPKNFLPEDAAEGAVLNLTFEVDEAATDEAKQHVQNLIDRLSRGDHL